MKIEYKVTLLVPIEVTLVADEPMPARDLQYCAERQVRLSVRSPGVLKDGSIVIQSKSERQIK